MESLEPYCPSCQEPTSMYVVVELTATGRVTEVRGGEVDYEVRPDDEVVGTDGVVRCERCGGRFGEDEVVSAAQPWEGELLEVP